MTRAETITHNDGSLNLLPPPGSFCSDASIGGDGDREGTGYGGEGDLGGGDGDRPDRSEDDLGPLFTLSIEEALPLRRNAACADEGEDETRPRHKL